MFKKEDIVVFFLTEILNSGFLYFGGNKPSQN